MATHKREIQGKVISKSGEKTAKITVERRVVHPRYKKIVKRFKNYMIHDEKNETQIGDTVTAIECKPFSKMKCFRLKNIDKREVTA